VTLSGEPEWPQNSLFQHPKRRYFAEISAFARLSTAVGGPNLRAVLSRRNRVY
jgi:hypothetical protein